MFFLIIKECDEKTCLNGLCDSSNRCFCFERYITWKADSGVECNYFQKSKFGAFMLEFFFGMEFGVGYFYLGLNTLGVLQLIFFLPTLFLFCFVFCCCMATKAHENPASIVCGIFWFFVWIFGMFGWWIYAIVGMGTGFIVDSNGAPTSDHLYL